MEQNNIIHEQERLIELSLAPKNYDGAENTSFTPQQVKASSLKDVFTSNNYSQIIWATGYRLKENFRGAKGFCLDIDGGMKISEAEDILRAQDLNYVLITTRSHSESNPRFRIFVPFTHNIHSLLRYQAAAHKLDELFGGKCDPAVFDGARFLFGSPADAYYSDCWTGHDFDVSGIKCHLFKGCIEEIFVQGKMFGQSSYEFLECIGR